VTSDASTVFLLDVDNTLLDNDGFAADLGERLELYFGAEQRARYWSIFNQMREQFGVADYLGALQQFRVGLDDRPEMLRMSEFLMEYPFAARLFAGALQAIAHLNTLGRAAVLSDGDVVFQPRKIQRSGVWDAVEGRVMIYLHKERVLDHMQLRYPAAQYVMVDDKPNLLAAMKTILGARLTTVFVRQGHYALAPQSNAVEPKPDVVIEHIADLINLNSSDFQVRL
jgi:FMN phosphatase YigB (HAD superfamily)